MTERTLVLVKPDGVRRGLIGEVLSRIERKGLRIVAMDLRTLDSDTAKTHYAEHVGQAVLRASSSTSSPRGRWSPWSRRVRGRSRRSAPWPAPPTRSAPRRAPSAAITRWIVQQNIVHGSDSPDAAEREIKIFFPDLV